MYSLEIPDYESLAVIYKKIYQKLGPIYDESYKKNSKLEKSTMCQMNCLPRINKKEKHRMIVGNFDEGYNLF